MVVVVAVVSNNEGELIKIDSGGVVVQQWKKSRSIVAEGMNPDRKNVVGKTG